MNESLEQHHILDSNTLSAQQKLNLLEKIQERSILQTQGKPPSVRVIHKRSNTDIGLTGANSRLENYQQEFAEEDLRTSGNEELI